jgi:hypothetical protein
MLLTSGREFLIISNKLSRLHLVGLDDSIVAYDDEHIKGFLIGESIQGFTKETVHLGHTSKADDENIERIDSKENVCVNFLSKTEMEINLTDITVHLKG